MARYIMISDRGFVWHVPIEVIADNRAKYYAEKDKDTTYQDEFDYLVEDDYEAIDWMLNNMNWKDYKDHTILVASAVKTEPSDEADYHIMEVVK